MTSRTARLWLTGGLLLVVGGGASAIGAGIFNFGPADVGSWVTIVADVVESAGLILFGLGLGSDGLPRVGGRIVIAAGIFGLIEFVITVIEVSSATNLFIPSQAVDILNTVALLVGAIVIRASSTLRGPVAWALLPAGIWGVIDIALFLGGVGGEWSTLVLFGILYIVAGVAIRTGTGRLLPGGAANTAEAPTDLA